MTISLDSNKVAYTGNGVTTVFPFSFRVDDATHLQAYVMVIATGVLTLLTQNVDYTVSGVPGVGSVTYNPLGVPLPATKQLLIVRLVPVLQGLDINNQGGFYPETLEAQLDLMTMVDQQQEEQLGRAVKSPYGQPGYDLPKISPNGLIGWNASGTALENKTVASFGAVLVDNDTTLAADSATSVASQHATKTYADTKMAKSANLSDLADKSTARLNLIVATTVTTRTALKALDTTKDTMALLAEVGREGLFIWRSGDYSAQIAVDTAEGVYVKATAIAASVGAWVRNSGGWAVFGVSPDMFGAVGDGTTVDNTAMQAAATFAATYGVPLCIPGKTYRLTTPIAVTAPITVRGAGMALSRLVWDSGNGLSVTASVSKVTTISDISLETKGIAAGTALTLDYSTLISGGNILPRAETHAKLHRVRIRGATNYTTDGWLNGVSAISLLGLDVDSCRINGVYLGAYGAMPDSAKGVSFSGSGNPVQLTVTRSFFSAWADAVYTADAEGIYLTSNEMVTVGRGYQCVNAAVQSGLRISGNHIATVDEAIKIGNMADGSIDGNVIYNVADVTPLKGIHIQTGCKNINIGRNVIRRLGAVSLMLGVHLEAGQDIIVLSNEFDLGSTQVPIQIGSGFTRAIVYKQHYISTPSGSQITDGGTSSMFEEIKGYAGDLNSITIDQKMYRQLHILAAGATNVPPSYTSTAGAVIETVTVDAATAYQIAVHPNIVGTRYVRRFTSSAWGAWEREHGAVVTKTIDFTVGNSENQIIVNKGSTCTVTLPTPSQWPGREITLKTSQAFTVVSASSNVVPLITASAGTAILAGTAGKWAKLVSDGTNWVIMEGN